MVIKYCDICGQFAKASTKDKAHSTKAVFYNNCSGNSKCEIAVKVSFSFLNHPDQFNKRPDLCSECSRKIIAELADAPDGIPTIINGCVSPGSARITVNDVVYRWFGKIITYEQVAKMAGEDSPSITWSLESCGFENESLTPGGKVIATQGLTFTTRTKRQPVSPFVITINGKTINWKWWEVTYADVVAHVSEEVGTRPSVVWSYDNCSGILLPASPVVTKDGMRITAVSTDNA